MNLSTPYGKHKRAARGAESHPVRHFLLPMGNINRGPGPAGLYAADLSTPYGKHKQRDQGQTRQAGSLSTPYGKHKLVSLPEHTEPAKAFYSLWET